MRAFSHALRHTKFNSTDTTFAEYSIGAHRLTHDGESRENNGRTKWLRYEEAAAYIGWSVGHLRNVVSRGGIPVYGRPYHRRFRADTLDMFIKDRDQALGRHNDEQAS